MLRHEYSFWKNQSPADRQQAQRDLIKAFKRYYDQCLKSAVPTFLNPRKTRKTII